MLQGTRMHMRGLLLLLAATAFVVSGCANMTETQRDVAVGAGVGAAAGALIGKGKGAAIGAGVGAAGGYVWSRYMENKRQQMQQATAGTGVDVTQTDDNRLKLNIPSDISFDTNRSDIKPNMRPILDSFADGLRDQPQMEVYVVGHTDSTGNDAINDPLSVDRANSVRRYLVQRGVSDASIQTEGRGSHDPIASNATVEGRAANRRVEIFLAERAGVADGNYGSTEPGNTPIGTPAR